MFRFERHEPEDRPVGLNLVDDGMIIGTQVDKVLDCVALLFCHGGIISGGLRLFASNMSRLASISVCAVRRLIGQHSPASGDGADASAPERQDNLGWIGC